MAVTVGPSPRVHDLVRFSAAGYRSALPRWVLRDGDDVWGVVRRQHAPALGSTALGLRGTGRAERAAIEVHDDDVLDVVTPEDLVARPLDATVNPGLARALATLGTTSSDRFAGLPWGPTGSAGFELATGTPAVRATSDLDMILRAEDRVAPDDAAAVLEFLSTLPCRVDCLLETPFGAVALAEWVASAGGGAVLLRTPDGPVLTADPWQADGR